VVLGWGLEDASVDTEFGKVAGHTLNLTGVVGADALHARVRGEVLDGIREDGSVSLLDEDAHKTHHSFREVLLGVLTGDLEVCGAGDGLAFVLVGGFHRDVVLE